MFEIIGVLFGMALLFVVAALLSVMVAGAGWLLLPRQSSHRRLIVMCGAAIPILSAVSFWFCIALLPGESVFGDISQPLPNGYSLQALGKMPDFASIYIGESMQGSSVNLSQCIGSIAVAGSLVVGRYSHPCDKFDAEPDEPFFIFNTTAGNYTDYPDLSSAQTRIGHPVRLLNVVHFRSMEPHYLAVKRRNHMLMFAPPIALGLFYCGVLFYKRLTVRAPL